MEDMRGYTLSGPELRRGGGGGHTGDAYGVEATGTTASF